MEYIEGISLHQADCLTLTERFTVFKNYCFFCRKNNYMSKLHGDMHPGNLLITPDLKIGVLDFGLVKMYRNTIICLIL